MDIALGGQGAPIVPIGEKLLFNEHDFFLNIGGIANISHQKNEQFIAFDVCPANSILNRLANEAGKEYDDGGAMAAEGNIDMQLLEILNAQNITAIPIRNPYQTISGRNNLSLDPGFGVENRRQLKNLC